MINDRRLDDDTPQPRTEVGRALVDALSQRRDHDSWAEWIEGSFFTDVFTDGQGAVAWVCVMTAGRHRFGAPPDVRAITRWLAGLRDRVPACREMPLREVEAFIRVVLGEYWLDTTIDYELLAQADPGWTAVWFVLLREHLESTGADPAAVVAAAEAQVIAGGFGAEVSKGLRSLGTAITDDATDSRVWHPAVRALRRALWEHEG